jgi:hypothetical protein
VEESGAARERAERIAESGAPSAAELRSPAPSLLAAPVTGKPAAGFDRLFAGHGEIVGEVADSGVTVRARRSYSELGIEAPVSSNGGFATSSMTDLQYLSCGNHAFPALQALGKKLHDVAKAVARVNGVIAAGSPWRVESVFAVSEASRLHFADGKALITLAPEDLENAAVETVMHEASHAVFESHSHPDAKHPEALAPDTFALRFADLYLRLASTRPVVVPAKPFRKQRPAFEARGEHAREPAGHVMVTDGLWSGGAKTDGHPWDGPDEFFASAFGAFVHDEKLLGEIIAHYGTADGAIPAAGAELLAMLRALKDPKALASMRGLTTAAESQAATAAIKARESGSTTIKDRLGSVLDPAKIEPATVNCPAPAKKP